MDTMMNPEQAMTSLPKAASFGQGYTAAIMRSTEIWTSGCQSIGETMRVAGMAHFERSVAAMTSLSHVKSPKEAIDIQSGFARTSMEAAIANATKLSEDTKKLVEEASAPIKEQMTQIGAGSSPTANPPHVGLM